MTLASPVDHRHRKAAVAQIAHRLEIFFDLLGAPGEDADGALAARRRRPARKAQFRAVGGLDGAGDVVFRNLIGGNGDERHGRNRLGGEGRKSRVAGGENVKKSNNPALLNPVSAFPISLSCRPLPVLRNRNAPCFGIETQGCTRTKPGPMAGGLPRNSRSMEDYLCVPTILPRFIVPPSASTACFPCSTRPLLTAAPVIPPTISSGPARTPTASRLRYPASRRASFRSSRRKIP